MQDDSLVRQPNSSTEESDTEDRASESHTSNNSDTPVPRYRIPMRRRSGEPGVCPRSTSPSSMDSFNTETQRPERPKRTRQPPAWMRSPDWVVSQVPVYEFWVDPTDVVKLQNRFGGVLGEQHISENVHSFTISYHISSTASTGYVNS